MQKLLFGSKSFVTNEEFENFYKYRFCFGTKKINTRIRKFEVEYSNIQFSLNVFPNIIKKIFDQLSLKESDFYYDYDEAKFLTRIWVFRQQTIIVEKLLTDTYRYIH